MNSLLNQIEALDREIAAEPDRPVDNLTALLDRRTALCCRLLPSLKAADETTLARISGILANTEHIRQSLALLRSKAVEDQALLERQDDLLKLLNPVHESPCYVDYSA